MKTKRLNIRIEAEVLQQVKEVAARQGVTVTFLVTQYFRRLVGKEQVILLSTGSGEQDHA